MSTTAASIIVAANTVLLIANAVLYFRAGWHRGYAAGIKRGIEEYRKSLEELLEKPASFPTEFADAVSKVYGENSDPTG